MGDNICFKAEPRKIGNSIVVTVPMAFFTHGNMKEGQKYLFEVIKPIKEDQDGTESNSIIS